MRDINSVRYSATPEFRTHLNYVKYLNRVTRGMALEVAIDAKGRLNKAPELRKYSKLSQLTGGSIENDFKLSEKSYEFARIVAPWFPPKCYYRVYYLESILLYLINGNTIGFNAAGGHRGVRENMNRHFKSGALKIQCEANIPEVMSILECLNFSAEQNETILFNYWKSSKCASSIMKKIANYTLDDWARTKGYSDFRRTNRRIDRGHYLNKTDISLFDYFYRMRIKANYKDVDFLNLGYATDKDIYQYILYYYNFYKNYSNSLVGIINMLAHRIS